MNDITRKKDTGEPGNGGQFGSATRDGSGLTLAPQPSATAKVTISTEATVHLDALQDLPPLPEGMRDPSVSWGYGSENGERCTYFFFGEDADQVSAWDDGPYGGVGTSFDHGDGPHLSPEDEAAVKAYVKAAHRNVVNVIASLECALETTAQEQVVALATRGATAADPA